MSKKRIINPDLIPYKQDMLTPATLLGKVAGKNLYFGRNVDLTAEFNSKQDKLTPATVLARINGKAITFGGSVVIEGGSGEEFTTKLYRGTNLFDKEATTLHVSLNSSDGTLNDNSAFDSFMVSDYIPVEEEESYTFSARYTVAWYDESLFFVSSSASAESSVKTLKCPKRGKYMRFSVNYRSYPPEQIVVNKGTTGMAWEEYEAFLEIDSKYLKRYSLMRFGLEISTVKLSGNGISEPTNLCLIATRCIRKEGQLPDYTGYLYLDIVNQKLYYSNNTPDSPEYLCDWDKTKASNEKCENWCATITADGDIIFLRNWIRRNPIVYPHGDYSHPYIVDMGNAKKPDGYLMGSSVVAFDDGSLVWGDYTNHKKQDEINNDGRCIWHVSKPYDNPSNWIIAHEFKHVYFDSPISDQPNNEIGHIHAVNYDWIKDVAYCTTGDIDRHCRLWYSLDKGCTWQAVPDAVGDIQGNSQTIGQKWRFTNMIFLEDYVYWCTDSFKMYHAMYRVKRNNAGVIDASTLEKVAQLEKNIPNGMTQATYATAYIREPHGLLIIDRAEPRTDGILDVKFYSFEDNSLYVVRSIKRAKTDASNLDTDERIGLPNQTTMQCEPQTDNFIMCGGGTVIRPHNTELFNNSKSNYVGALKLKVVKL